MVRYKKAKLILRHPFEPILIGASFIPLVAMILVHVLIRNSKADDPR